MVQSLGQRNLEESMTARDATGGLVSPAEVRGILGRQEELELAFMTPAQLTQSGMSSLELFLKREGTSGSGLPVEYNPFTSATPAIGAIRDRLARTLDTFAEATTTRLKQFISPAHTPERVYANEGLGLTVRYQPRHERIEVTIAGQEKGNNYHFELSRRRRGLARLFGIAEKDEYSFRYIQEGTDIDIDNLPRRSSIRDALLNLSIPEGSREMAGYVNLARTLHCLPEYLFQARPVLKRATIKSDSSISATTFLEVSVLAGYLAGAAHLLYDAFVNIPKGEEMRVTYYVLGGLAFFFLPGIITFTSSLLSFDKTK